MHIESITVSNFENLEGSWDFGKVTEFRGRNGAGKSALGRAIGWCLTGLDAYGDRRTDHVMRDPQKPTVVTLNLKDQQIIRRKTLSSNTLTVDELPVGADHFGDPHLILSSFIPGYFQDMDEKKKRALFMDLLPPVDIAALFEERTGLDVKKRAAMRIFFNDPLVTPEKLHKRWSTTRLDKQKELEQLKGGENELALRVGELEQKLKEAQASEDTTDLDELEREGKNLRGELLTLKNKRADWATWKTHADTYQAHLKNKENLETELKVALDGMTLQQMGKKRDAAFKHYSTLTKKRGKHAEWEILVEDRDRAEAKQAKKLDILDAGLCYTCTSELNTTGLKVLRKELLGDVQEPGKEPKDVAEKDVQAAYDELGILRGNVDVAMKLEGMLKDYQLPEKIGPEPEAVDQAKIEDMEDTLRGVRDNYAAAKASVKATKEIVESQHVQARNDLQANKELQVEVSGQVERLQAVEEALHPARGVFAQALEKQLEGVKELLPAWEFELTETAKTTGNARPCFREYLKLDNYQVPLRYCSAGQQLRAGIDLCRALDTLNGDKLGMVFVDNFELLSGHLGVDESVQEFRCVVVDTDLAVEVLETA